MSLEYMQNILNIALNDCGFEHTPFGESGMASATVHGLRVALEYAPGVQSLILWASIGALPAEPTRELYEYLLGISLMGKGTEGGHIGLYGPSRTLVFSVILSANGLDGHSLANALSRFAGKAAELIREVEERGSAAAEPDLAALMANALWV